MSRSRRVVPDEFVTLMSWISRDFLIFLVMVGWKGKDAANKTVNDKIGELCKNIII